MKTGILGGTFDPIHNGHLAIAEEAFKVLGLDVVLFIPAGQPLLKSNKLIAAAVHRLEMVRLAIDGRPYFKLSRIEIERSGPSYSVDTIARLKAASGGDSEWYFIMGCDKLRQLPMWKDPAKLVELSYPVVFPRPGINMPDVKELEESLPGISEKVVRLEKPLLDISSTDIRQRVAQNLSVEKLVPEAVFRYIVENRLYKAD